MTSEESRYYQPATSIWEGLEHRECHEQAVTVNAVGHDCDFDCDYSGLTEVFTMPGEDGAVRWTCPTCGSEHFEERDL